MSVKLKCLWYIVEQAGIAFEEHNSIPHFKKMPELGRKSNLPLTVICQNIKISIFY